MKKLTKLLALVLCLALVLSLGACAKQASPALGSWKCTLDLKELSEKATAAAAEKQADGEGQSLTEEQLKNLTDIMGKLYEGCSMTILLDLKEDQSYTLSMDEASIKATVTNMGNKLPELMPELLAAMFGQSLDGLKESLAEMNMSLDDMMKEMGDSLNAEELLKSLEITSQDGTWRYEEGKLYLTPKADASEDKTGTETTEAPVETQASADAEAAQEICMTVEFNGSEMKVTAMDGKSEDLEDFKEILPLIFTKDAK